MNAATIVGWITRLVIVFTGALSVACSAQTSDMPARNAPTPPASATLNSATTSTPTPDDGNVSVPEQPWWQVITKTPAPPKPEPIHSTFTMSGDVLFQPDRADLTTGAASQLAVILAIVQLHPGVHVLVAGNTDKGSGGTEARAVSLSQARVGRRCELVHRSGRAGQADQHDRLRRYPSRRT